MGNANVEERRTTRRLTDGEAQAVGEASQQSVEMAIGDALDSIGPKVGDVVTKKMVEKFPALKTVGDTLINRAKAVAEQAVNSKRSKIMNFVQDASSDLEGTLPEILTLMMQAVKAASTSTVDKFSKCCRDRAFLASGVCATRSLVL